MELQSRKLKLILSDDNMSIVSLTSNGTELCASGGESRPIFTIKLLDKNGNEKRYNAFDAENVEKSGEGVFLFENLKGSGISVKASVKAYDDGFAWHMSFDNKSDLFAEWTEFPQLTLKGALKGDGGEYSLFWPAMEGQVVESSTLREKTWKYKELGGRSVGYSGFYPGSCPMQFMAYYSENCGLYFAAHDKEHNPKTVEYYRNENGIVLEYRLFTSGAKGKYDYGYDMIMEDFSGDWYDAAEIYRTWMEENTVLPPKIADNPRIPDWMELSPIVVLYPIRGTVDSGDMTPNMYYPYKNILPITKNFNEKTNSKIMALPMHWEGTAPWATPYVWPPFGGEDEFYEFVSEVHKQDNLVGVYCSGIGWTTESFSNPALDFSDRYDEKLMCRTPQGTIEQSLIVGEPIRHGYDMCPQSEKVDEIVAAEVISIAKSGCDYAQYFDQNLGGESCFCYAHNHGHPPAPGVWQNNAMKRIFAKVYEELDKIGSKLIIGCECAASEPFIEYLPFNDLRYNIGFFVGRPVPAYAYLFHEYLNNFMGNQNTIHWCMDLKKTPDCMLYRMAYSFTAGDLLTVCLGKDGNIIFGWDVPWEVDVPEQESLYVLMKNLNRHRIEGKEFLHLGRMIKSHPLKAVGKYKIYLGGGDITETDSLITTRWKAADGRERQIIVNFLNCEQTCIVEATTIYENPNKPGKATDGKIIIPPLSAIWVD